jgi:hypothetical protein
MKGKKGSTKMKYKTQDTLQDWQHHADEMKELTKHADSKTNKKTTITAVLTSINAERLLGAKVVKVGKQKMVKSTTTPTPLMPALVQALGDNVTSLPELLSTYYWNVYQRPDYKDALLVALNNIVAIDYVVDRHHQKTPASQRKLFQVFSRDDIYRDDKHILSDVARAVSLALINKVSGQQLTKTAGRGLYLTRDAIRDCMARPTEATNEQLSNALVLLRISGYLHLAQDDELTEAGKKLATTFDAKGNPVASHRVYVVGDFAEADWSLVQRSFRLNLNCRIGHDVLTQLLGHDTVASYFPDLSGGVTGVVVGMMLSKVNEVGDNTPVCTLKAARDTCESITGVSSATASKWIDQCLAIRPVHAAKMTTKEARENGYNLDEWEAGSPAQKLVVPVTEDALMMCIERLKRANAKGIKVSQLIDD